MISSPPLELKEFFSSHFSLSLSSSLRTSKIDASHFLLSVIALFCLSLLNGLGELSFYSLACTIVGGLSVGAKVLPDHF